MNGILRACWIFIVFIFPINALAAAYTPWAAVSQIERVGNGVLIYGAFGDANSCGEPDVIYYPSTHDDYDVVLSMALTALTADREMRFYVSSCTAISFHWGVNPVINQAHNGQAIYIR